MDTYLGLDLGGTKLMIGEVDSLGNILNLKKYCSGFFNQRDAVDIIKTSVNDYIETVGWHGSRPKGMGIGLVGRVDAQNGVWLQIDPTRNTEIHLAQELENAFNLPCAIDNDVKSATYAEMLWGFGRTSRNFIYINVGTGIAAGTVVNGQLIRGSHFNAGEIGHTKVGVNIGVKCGCGRMDCVEAIASGSGIDKCTRLLVDKYQTSLYIPDDKDGRVNTREVFALAQKGDALCKVLVDNAAEAIADLIMNLVRVTDPEIIVLGGGVVADGFLLEKIKGHLNPSTLRFVTGGVVLTKLNPEFIGLLGAAALAMNNTEQEKKMYYADAASN